MPVGSLDVTLYRDDLRLRGVRPLAQTELPPAASTTRSWSWSTTCSSPAAPCGPRSTRSPTSAGRAPSSSPSWSTAATASCRSAPTTSARTSRPRCARPCTSCWRRTTAATPCCSVRRRAQSGRGACGGPPGTERHLLSAADLTPRRRAARPRHRRGAGRLADRPIKKLPTLRGRTVVNLFFEDSTRTRISFEAAAKRLSADVINFSAKGSSVSKGESLKDTALTLEAMGADAVVVRHRRAGAPHRLANWIRGSVVNAGDGTHEHPTQALLDAFTMRRRLGPARRAAGRHRRRRPALAGGPVQRAAARHPRRRGHPGRAADAAAGRRRGVARARSPTTSTPCLPKSDVGDDAAGPARADERRRSSPPPASTAAATASTPAGWRLLPDDAIVMHPGPDEPRAWRSPPRSPTRCGRRSSSRSPTGSAVRMAVLYLLLGGPRPEAVSAWTSARCAAALLGGGRGPRRTCDSC